MGATDSKLAFRKNIFRLFEDRSIAVTENEYWEQFWSLPDSSDDVFSLIGANDVRRIRDTCRENFENLIDKILEKMQAILKAHNFPSEQHSISHLLNCCRILAKIMPFVFESPECTEWEEAFFWTPRQIEKQTNNANTKPEYEMLSSRGELLSTLTIQALFFAGFTLPIALATKESKVNYTIWENGVGSTIPIASYKDNESNRTEVLRLFTVLLSRSMYVQPNQLLVKEDLWLRHVAVKTERKIVLVIICSLMNTVCNYDPTGWVPYNHVVGVGPYEQLVNFCLTDLLILLDYRSPQQADIIVHRDSIQGAQQPQDVNVEVLTLDSPNGIAKSSVELEAFTPQDGNKRIDENAFRYYLSKLHRTQDFEFLMKGVHRLLINPMTAINTYLPRSTKRTDCYVGVMMFCWRLIETNSRFSKYLVETDYSLDLTIALVFHAAENKDNIAQIGLVRMCAFILQTLSSNKEFSANLNKPFVTHSSLPASIRLYAFNGTYADFLIISIFSLITTTKGKLATLYPSLILTISNISPYLTNLGVTTCSKLLAMFHSMSSPTFLLSDEHNFALTSYILESFNNMMHYHFTENSNLVYSIVLHHNYFEKLDELTFNGAVQETERVRVLRETKMVSVEGPNTDTGSAPDTNLATSKTIFEAETTAEIEPTITEGEATTNTVTKPDVTEPGITEPDVTEPEVTEPDIAEPKVVEPKVVESKVAEPEVAEPDVSEPEVTEPAIVEGGIVVDATTDQKESETKGKEKESAPVAEANSLQRTTSPDTETTKKEDPAIISVAAASTSKTETETEAETEAEDAPLSKSILTEESHIAPDNSNSNRNILSIVRPTRSGFLPTEAWFQQHKSYLPLNTVLAVLENLVPQVEEKCSANNSVTLEELMSYLKTVQVKLPEQEANIYIRKFQWGEALVIWFRSMVWGQNYINSMKENGVWNGTHVSLFQIKEA